MNPSCYVSVPVANLRKNPEDHSLSYKKDPNQESQLLYGQKVNIIKREGGWAYVEALEQRKMTSAGESVGYPGWVREGCLQESLEDRILNLVVTALFTTAGEKKVYFGTYLSGEKLDGNTWRVFLPSGEVSEVFNQDVRQIPENPNSLLEDGSKFLGFPYLWGGCSPYDPDHLETVTSVDCSGLVYLLCRAQGISVPRDSHDQYLLSKKISMHELKPSDLVFMMPLLSSRVNHVMIYVGGDVLLEATEKVGTVREVSFEKRFGVSFETMLANAGDLTSKTEEYLVHFGRVLKG